MKRVLLAIAFVVLGVQPCSAEWFADIYLGVSKPTDEELKISGITPGLKLRYDDVEFDRSFTYGGRFGKYFDSLPWIGVSVDALSFSPDIGQQSAVQSASTGSVARTTLPPIDISATVKAYFALKMIGDSPDADHMRRAREALRSRGGAVCTSDSARLPPPATPIDEGVARGCGHRRLRNGLPSCVRSITKS